MAPPRGRRSSRQAPKNSASRGTQNPAGQGQAPAVRAQRTAVSITAQPSTPSFPSQTVSAPPLILGPLLHPGSRGVRCLGLLTGSAQVNSSDRRTLVSLYHTYQLPFVCHTCGCVLSANDFVCDHQPPTEMVSGRRAARLNQILGQEGSFTVYCAQITHNSRRTITVQTPIYGLLGPDAHMFSYPMIISGQHYQFLYPQCRHCSNLQGGLINGL